MVSTSARGTASQIPGSPITIGRSMMEVESSKKVRKKEIRADTTPLEKAVNIEEAKMFSPVKIKAINYKLTLAQPRLLYLLN